MEPVALSAVQAESSGEMRMSTTIAALDNTLGGGLVAGSLTLLGGDPGVGKSTLLLMMLGRLAGKGLPVLYVSGEESVRQIRLRAQRLGIHSDSLFLVSHTDYRAIEETTRKLKPLVVVIDSVQTVGIKEEPGLPGTVNQVRTVAHQAMMFAKQTDTATLLVGHITKSGDLAGPKVLEHFVDTVLYFEGDGRSSLRVLRTIKNRFGPSGEIGLFEMVTEGLVEVPDASTRLLGQRTIGCPGTAIVSTLEGSRPLLAEVQALVGESTNHSPARTCVGVDRNRVLMIVAVLQKAGVPLADRDIFVNATGGLSLNEPAADLAIAMAIATSFRNVTIPANTIIVGEVGLVGEVRAVSRPLHRLQEAARHGFQYALVPKNAASLDITGLRLHEVKTIGDALNALF